MEKENGIIPEKENRGAHSIFHHISSACPAQ
jgi:hypothetical protein